MTKIDHYLWKYMLKITSSPRMLYRVCAYYWHRHEVSAGCTLADFANNHILSQEGGAGANQLFDMKICSQLVLCNTCSVWLM